MIKYVHERVAYKKWGNEHNVRHSSPSLGSVSGGLAGYERNMTRIETWASKNVVAGRWYSYQSNIYYYYAQE